MASIAELAGLETKAAEVANLLRLIANEKRLLILCLLGTEKEMTVTQLAAAVNLSQSALSQHLAKLRADDLVATRREAQMLHYRIADPRVEALLGAMAEIFCPEIVRGAGRTAD
ncbi:ArsR/SmtB family transcription factor [Lutibaculum baratangense]|uniref:Transcriptional regulator, ArsR family n=1 Tax=Lutibaculum baratangense AMV1 TaxID=631454 RepID=V4RGN0_9HYPH|nr:metalloregulator ArsR/SmtB family transcription factor [Lutibaculum baratangense]ESR25311.1 Transcriptional regulator, ArsR family [Lutibaculum baratangense AMV1]